MGSEAAKTVETPSVNRKFVGYMHNVSKWLLLRSYHCCFRYSKRYLYSVKPRSCTPQHGTYCTRHIHFYTTSGGPATLRVSEDILSICSQGSFVIALHPSEQLQCRAKNSQQLLTLVSAVLLSTMQQVGASTRDKYLLISWTAWQQMTSAACGIAMPTGCYHLSMLWAKYSRTSL